MIFLKKFAIAFIAITLILGGGAGTQSTSMMLQGGGFIGLIIGLIVLYIFFKMAWRAMGCLPSFLIFAGITTFILYAIGGFNGGILELGNNLKRFLGQQKAAIQRSSTQALVEQQNDLPQIGENFSTPDEFDEEETEFDYNATPELFEEPAPKPQTQSPQAGLPGVSAPAEVISGDTLKIRGRFFRLFGIDAPELNQNCADVHGRSYNCGIKSRSWLKGWIMNYNLDCKVMGQSGSGTLIGTCALGEYDLGAALVNAGWAVAYRSQTDVYVPYEEQAKKNRRGLWKGQFYMPWDWRELQSKKPKIKVVKPKSSSKGFFNGW